MSPYVIAGGSVLLALMVVLSWTIARGQYRTWTDLRPQERQRRAIWIVLLWMLALAGIVTLAAFAIPAFRDAAPDVAISTFGLVGFILFLRAGQEGRISQRMYVAGRVAFPFIFLGVIALLSLLR
jgi:hypothetical protein